MQPDKPNVCEQCQQRVDETPFVVVVNHENWESRLGLCSVWCLFHFAVERMGTAIAINRVPDDQRERIGARKRKG